MCLHINFKGYSYDEVYKASITASIMPYNPPLTRSIFPMTPLIAKFMGPTWGPSGADRTQVGPMLAPWTLLSGTLIRHTTVPRKFEEWSIFMAKKLVLTLCCVVVYGGSSYTATSLQLEESFSVAHSTVKTGITISRLTHWGRDKMAATFKTMFSNTFSWMKIYEFRLRFHWSFFLMVQLTIFQHWFRQWLGADQATSHHLSQWWIVYWHIFASLGLNELTNIPYSVHKLTQYLIKLDIEMPAGRERCQWKNEWSQQPPIKSIHVDHLWSTQYPSVSHWARCT